MKVQLFPSLPSILKVLMLPAPLKKVENGYYIQIPMIARKIIQYKI
jgi:hypothetical protein